MHAPERPGTKPATFDRLVLDLVGECASPSYVEIRHDAAGGHDSLRAAGWRGHLLTAGRGGVRSEPSAAPADVTVEHLETWTELSERVRALGSPAFIDVGAGALRAEVLDAVVCAQPAVVRMRIGGSATGMTLAQGRLQDRGYTVICQGDSLVGVLGRKSMGPVAVAERLAALGTTNQAHGDDVLAGSGAADRAALRWAERYFREWRAVVNERNHLAVELAKSRAVPPVEPQHPVAPRARTVGLDDPDGLPRRVARRLKRVATRLVPHEEQVLENDARSGTSHAQVQVRTAQLDGALALRLTQLATVLGGDAGRDPVGAVHELLRAETPQSARWWLVHAVLTGSVPTEQTLAGWRERVAQDGAGGALRSIVAEQGRATGDGWQRTAPVEVAVGKVFVDISHTVQTELRTGVQRVVRNTVPTWLEMGAEPIVFDDGAGTWRRPDSRELSVIAGWSGGDPGTGTWVEEPVVVVPESCSILVPELKPRAPLSALRAASTGSTNEFSWIVYDMIPVLAGEFVPDDVVAGSVDYLSTLKRARRLVAISRSAATEFSGLVAGLTSQGIPGPDVACELLPLVPPPPREPAGDVEARSLRSAPDLPLALCVSSISPHKNQETLLSAAERLAEAGTAFELLFVAPNAWHADGFRARLSALQAKGMAVSVVADVSEAGLWSLYRNARCVALISRVEGYGLPLAEALSVGTPVLSSNFGSMAEIVSDGGGLMVDPTDVMAVSEALGRLLGDVALHRELADAAARRPLSSWEAYARRTWSLLLEPEENR